MDLTTFDCGMQLGEQRETVDLQTIGSSFKKVQDGRKAHGKRYPLHLLLTLLFLGKLAGEQTVSGIIDWAKEREWWLKRQRGWPRRLPAVSTVTKMLQVCSAEEVEQAIMCALRKARDNRQYSEKVQQDQTQRERKDERKQTAMDGKTLCGTQKHQSQDQPPLHLLSLYECETGIILRQKALLQKKSEITGAKSFLDSALIYGRIFTSDAIHTQREWCAGVHGLAGFYLTIVKKNQKRLYRKIEEFFENKEKNQGEWQYFQQTNKGHGREEMREIWTSTRMRKRLARTWKGVVQVCKIRRIVKSRGKESIQIAYGITNLPREKADAEHILELNRKHWYIENRLHYRRDVTLKEDASQVRTKNAPQVIAALNSGVLAVMDYLGVKNVASQMRHFCAKPEEALKLILDPLPLQNGKTK
ncbi:MAG TPA: ISAs1 family transposase [Ktedonobacteraceae bacterium]|jgi:predicted transposase YbfD/YdcC